MKAWRILYRNSLLSSTRDYLGQPIEFQAFPGEKRRMILTLAMATLIPLSHAGGWNGRIVEVGTEREVGLAELGWKASLARTVVLGEEHYNVAVQAAQAEVLRMTVEAAGAEGKFALGWEFLNHSEQERTDALFARLAGREIDAREFLRETQGRDAASYVPVIEAARDLRARLLGVNLSRAEKAPVVRGGIAAADPRLVPPGFAMGSDAYRERFMEAMGGHAPPERVANYFSAQCLTDDVMAYRLLEADAPLRFLVVGSFHSDYRDGVVARFRARASGEKVVAVRFVDASAHTAEELVSLPWDLRFGELADFVFYVNEPGGDQNPKPAPKLTRQSSASETPATRR
jgi:uncharacterized iron-regulated protein